MMMQGMDTCKDATPVPAPASADADADAGAGANATSCVGVHDPNQAVNVASSGQNGHGEAEAKAKATHSDAAEVQQAVNVAGHGGKLRSDGDDEDDDGRAVVGDGGQMFVEYFVYGKPFQVLAKYIPPFNPIGQGAYGFVWYAKPPSFFLPQIPCLFEISLQFVFGRSSSCVLDRVEAKQDVVRMDRGRSALGSGNDYGED
jgi:hypothetical protein